MLLAGFLFTITSCADKVNEEIFHYTDEEYEALTQVLDIPTETYDYPLRTTNGVISNESGIYHKATLGRVLFYDKSLSSDGTISCASCHAQEHAFADNKAFSEGIEEKVGFRNSLPLGNTVGFIAYYGTDRSVQSGFFSWDESNESINESTKDALNNPLEMGNHISEVVDKVKDQEIYQLLFKKAYGYNGAINEENVADAITEFVNSLAAVDTKFDEARGGAFNSTDRDFELFTPSENRGKRLFNTNCASCHSASHTGISVSKANNGLDMVYEDKGVGELTGSYEYGVFKVPSLRNIELTAPYMHDGRFQTLEEVVEHYSEAIVDHRNLDLRLTSFGNSWNDTRPSTSNIMHFEFTDEESAALVAFLKTLTDDNLMKDEKYADPFH